MSAAPKSPLQRSLELQPRLRLMEAGEAAFGPGKAELLRRIAAAGSIRAAASESSTFWWPST